MHYFIKLIRLVKQSKRKSRKSTEHNSRGQHILAVSKWKTSSNSSSSAASFTSSAKRFFRRRRRPSTRLHANAKMPDLDETLLVFRCSHFVRYVFFLSGYFSFALFPSLCQLTHSFRSLCVSVPVCVCSCLCVNVSSEHHVPHSVYHTEQLCTLYPVKSRYFSFWCARNVCHLNRKEQKKK